MIEYLFALAALLILGEVHQALTRKQRLFLHRVLLSWVLPFLVPLMDMNFRLRVKYPQYHIRLGRPWSQSAMYRVFGWSVNWPK
jgi:hypothetical protein